MAPLPQDSTARIWVHYTCGFREHVTMIRCGQGEAEQAVTDYGNYLTAISDLLRKRTITRIFGAPFNSNLSFPLALPLVGQQFGAGDASSKEDALSLSNTGRDLTGRRVSVHTFGAKDNFPPGDFRLQPGENAGVAAAYNLLSNTEGTFLTIGQAQPIWNVYMNVNFSAYWQKRKR